MVRGEHLVETGDPADSLYVVASGRLKDAILTEDGAEVIHSQWEPDMLFGEVGFFARQRTRLMSVIALEPSEVLVLGRKPVMEFLEAQPTVIMKMLVHLASTATSPASPIPILRPS